jgi:predicted ATPase/DNA-binding NarL/FixJ family response regulator
MAVPGLPLQPTPFVGRVDELAEIAALLVDPACRLLTLVGPGGIGKTRLALQAAADAQSHFADGVCFVALQPVTSTEFLVQAFADALHLAFYGTETPRLQLLRWLRPQQRLIVVDNFEHLLDDVALLTEIMEAAPGVKLLVTSRETLNVREEWVREVGGMRVPGDDQSVEPDSYDAVQLFVARARQARGDFALDRERPHVVRICQLVEGLPLAIELAAARIRTLSCAQIADELQRNLGLLATSLRNVPPRHRDMYAVFEPCWNRLTQAQREVFIRLAVFRGGFEREAAEQVAGASPSMLAALVDKSMLRVTQTGRYEMHELVRQYAAARLEEVTGESDRVRHRHCDYYARFLHGLEPEMKSSGQLDALGWIEEEIDNVRVAWRWAAGKRMEPQIEKSLDSLALVYHIRCWYQEAAEAFGMVVDELRNKRSAVLGRALMWQGQFVASLNGLRPSEASDQLLQEGASVLRELDAYGETAMPLWMVSEFNDDPERREEIRRFCLDNLAAFRNRGDRWGTGWALIGLGNVPLLEGAYEEARECFQEALMIFRETGDQLGMASVLQALIKVAFGQGAHLEERRYAEEALTLAGTIGDRGGIVTAQVVLGRAAFQLGAYEEAKQVLEQSLTVYRELYPGGVLPMAILAEAAVALGNRRQARHYLVAVLQGVTDDPEATACTLIGVARLLAAEGQKERAAELLAVTVSSPWGRRYSNHNCVKTLLADLETGLPPEVLAAASRRGETGDLKAMASALLDELSEHELSADVVFPSSVGLGTSEQFQIAQPLIDPLSERELEVLRLVADGLSNREIAQELVVTLGTVKKHINTIFGKLQVRSRIQAVARARELGLLP